MADEEPQDAGPQPVDHSELRSEPVSFPEIRPLASDQRPRQRVDVGAIGVLVVVGIAMLGVGTIAGVPRGALGWGVVLLAALAVLGMKRK